MRKLRFLAAALIAAASSISPALAAVTPRGEIVRVADPDCPMEGADVAALPGDRFVSVWAGRNPLGGGTSRIRGRVFGADGNPVGPELALSTGLPLGQGAPAVAAGEDGRFLVVWHDASRNEVFGRLFDPAGVPLNEEMRVSFPRVGRNPDVTALPGGGFAVAWTGDDGVRLRQYGAAGVPDGPIVGGGEQTTSIVYASQVSITALPSGGLGLAWPTLFPQTVPTSTTSTETVQVAVGLGELISVLRIPAEALTDSTRWVGSVIVPPDGQSVSNPRVGAQTNGDLVVVWKQSSSDQATLRLFAQLLDASGAERGPVRRLDGDAEWAWLGDPDLQVDPGGDGFVVTWDGLFVPGFTSIYARAFDAQGAGLGPVVMLAPEGDQGGRENTALARLDGGEWVAVWHEGWVPFPILNPCVITGIEARRFSAGCLPGPGRLCLGEGRFQLETSWSTPTSAGIGQAVPLTRDTGYFWFFDDDNVELMVKVLDGRELNGKLWVFYGSLSNVAWSLRVTDTVTGAVKTYDNPAGQLASRGDTAALPGAALAASAASAAASEGSGSEEFEIRPFESIAIDPGLLTPPVETSPAGPCTDPALPVLIRTGLCLQDRGFEVEVDWSNPFNGTSGEAVGVGLTDDSGYFWFFDHQNVELVVKVLDGRAVNGKFWVFYGALTNVEYTVRVRRASTGAEKTYHNPPFQFLSRADTAAF